MGLFNLVSGCFKEENRVLVPLCLFGCVHHCLSVYIAVSVCMGGLRLYAGCCVCGVTLHVFLEW